MQLQLKFRDDASREQRQRVIGDLSSRGATAVRPLFPDSRDPRRSSFYVVDLEDDCGEHQLLGILNDAEAVEFAEPELRRKLAR